jgi:hypothetical protein
MRANSLKRTLLSMFMAGLIPAYGATARANGGSVPPEAKTAPAPAPEPEKEAPPPAVIGEQPVVAPLPDRSEGESLERRGQSKRAAGIALMTISIASLIAGGVLTGVGAHEADNPQCNSVEFLVNCPGHDYTNKMIAGLTLLGAGTVLLPAGIATYVVGARQVERGRNIQAGLALMGKPGDVNGAMGRVGFKF